MNRQIDIIETPKCIVRILLPHASPIILSFHELHCMLKLQHIPALNKDGTLENVCCSAVYHKQHKSETELNGWQECVT